MADDDVTQDSKLFSSGYAFSPDFVWYPNIEDEIIESTCMLQEHFEKYGTVPQAVSFDELFN